MIKKKGKLTFKDYEQLGKSNPIYDKRDIPLIITKGIKEDIIEVSNAFVGIQYRNGKFDSKIVNIKNVVNDCFSGWMGNINIDHFYADHSLPVVYSKENHPDVFQVFSMNHKTFERHKHIVDSIKIKKATIFVKGSYKNIFMFTGISGYNNINLFEDGLNIKVTGTPLISKLFFNAISLCNSSLGSAENPLDVRKTSGLGIRIKGVKPNSPKSYNNIIHCYKNLPIDISKQVSDNTIIVYYKRTWTKQERIDYWSIYKDIINLGIKKRW